jgi:anti-sigma factor RsiW
MFNKPTYTGERSCTDQVVGDILSSWRYDISGLSSEMRTDYEQHLAECPQCAHRQRLHRNIDVFLITLTTFSVVAFLMAIAVIRHEETLRTWSLALQVHQMTLVLSLETSAVVGLLISLLAWVLVAIATPAPGYLNGMLHQHQEYRERHKHAA